MRHFSSYGPVDPGRHFCVARRKIVEQCVERLIGDREGGHYFTIWAPRQTGKTWLMRRAIEEIRTRHGERFIVGSISMQGVVMRKDEPAEAFLERVPDLLERGFRRTVETLSSWEDWAGLFRTNRNVFDRPVILLIDEFDKLPPPIIDRLVGLFRDMYLDPDNYLLHGLALVGVRAVLGVESDSGSPFNVQRSMKVGNLTGAETNEMFEQYQEETGQLVETGVRQAVFRVTRGQPGLVSWFGELLTERYNPGGPTGRPDAPINMEAWEDAYSAACQIEGNNSILNLVKKAEAPYLDYVMRLFAESDIPFSYDETWCNHLYFHGVIDHQKREGSGSTVYVCRFSSPFVQHRLYNSFTERLFGAGGPILALVPGDRLEDVFSPDALCLPPLIARYASYLKRLDETGNDPWENSPRRQDMNITEAVAHFHLYAWMRDAIGDYAAIIPEFPTGNGQVDLVIRYRDLKGAIEVKSFRNMLQLERGQVQAAQYAQRLGVDTATVALFVHSRNPLELVKLSGDTVVDGVRVVTVAIGWG